MPEVLEPVKEKKKLIVLNSANVEQKYKWNFSASQVDLWNACKRKYGFKYVDKIKGQNKFAARGSETHLHLENWLIQGIEPPLDDRYGRLARTGLKHLPLPGEAFIERGFKFISPSGISYLAYLDIEFFDKLISLPVVGDHKTTTDFKWAHTSESLVQNVQAVLYSNISFVNWLVDKLMLRWVYYKDLKNRPTSKKVEALATRADMSAKLAKIDAIAEEIALHGLTAKQAKDLPKNPLMCDQYGGCPYREICGVTDAEYLGARMTQMSIRDKLMQGKAKVEEVHQTESVQQPVVKTEVVNNGQPSALTALDRMRQRAAEVAKTSATASTVATSSITTEKATVVVQATAPAATPKPAGGSILSRLKNQTTSVVPAQTQIAPIKSMQTESAPPSSAQAKKLQEELDSESTVMSPELSAAIRAEVNKVESKTTQTVTEPAQHGVNAFDVNPPEQPRGDEIQDDPEALAASVAGEKASQKGKTVAAPVPAEDKPAKRGRPAGSTTVKPLSDEGYIFARVFADACKESRGNIEMATACAVAAVKAFRDLD